jgi:hypothetical protein
MLMGGACAFFKRGRWRAASALRWLTVCGRGALSGDEELSFCNTLGVHRLLSSN